MSNERERRYQATRMLTLANRAWVGVRVNDEDGDDEFVALKDEIVSALRSLGLSEYDVDAYLEEFCV